MCMWLRHIFTLLNSITNFTCVSVSLKRDLCDEVVTGDILSGQNRMDRIRYDHAYSLDRAGCTLIQDTKEALVEQRTVEADVSLAGSTKGKRDNRERNEVGSEMRARSVQGGGGNWERQHLHAFQPPIRFLFTTGEKSSEWPLLGSTALQTN